MAENKYKGQNIDEENSKMEDLKRKIKRAENIISEEHDITVADIEKLKQLSKNEFETISNSFLLGFYKGTKGKYRKDTYQMFGNAEINHDDVVEIMNRSYDLKIVTSALLFIHDALEHSDLEIDNDQLSSSIMLAIQKIEEVYMGLDKIEFRQETKD